MKAKIFQTVILPGKTHLRAVAVGGPMSQKYIESMAGFIDMDDSQ